MSDVHIYARDSEPATRYDAGAPVGYILWIVNNPRRQMWCHRCRQRRWASKLSVQVYYDMTYVFCTEKCKRHRNGR